MPPPNQPIPVGLLGATGVVGQRFATLLEDHPWFRLTWLGASGRSAGKRYAEAAHWVLEKGMPGWLAELRVQLSAPSSMCPELIFSALDSSVAEEIEQEFARAGHLVLSNARNHRMDPDVPLIIPEVNPDHLALIDRQREDQSSGGRGWHGAIVTNPNCSAIVLTLALAPLCRFGIRSVVVTTLQAVSGAGYPGVPSVDILGNVLPFVVGEEEKLATETLKLLGTLEDSTVHHAELVVSAQCNRVPVVDGHQLCVSVELAARPTLDEGRRAISSFRARPQKLGLPPAPAKPIVLADRAGRPQPRLDAAAGGGMTVTVGRVRRCPILGTKFVALGHNTVRGAAGASILNAELMLAEGWLDLLGRRPDERS